MARLLFIVARDRPSLLEFLRADFAAEEAAGAIEIFLDRREGRQWPDVQARAAEARDRSRTWDVRESLRELGCAFLPRQSGLPPVAD
jgi:hypothetical protein